MDDRFYNEDSSMNKSSQGGSFSSEKISTPGDFKVNIDSKNMGASDKKTKKFEVHIADYDSFSDFSSSIPKTETPSYTPYGGYGASENQNKTPKAETPTKKAAEPVQKQHSVNTVRQVQKSSAKRTASGVKKGVSLSGASASKTNAQRPKKTRTGKVQRNTKASADREKKRYNFIKTMLVLCVCVIFITLMTVTASMVALSTINDILVIDRSVSHSVSVTIPADSDFDDVFAILESNGLIRQPLVTKLFCKFRHYDQITKTDENGNKYIAKIEYEPGNYILDINSGIEANLEEIMVRSNVSKDTVRLTFPEGWTIAQIFDKIEKSNVCSSDKLYANLEIIGEQYSFIEDVDMVSGRYLKAEGYLFPDTYDFFIGENASSVLKKLLNNFDSRWKEEYTDQMKKLGLTKDEVINIAAIIQREAKDSTQMKDISSVIHNRLNDPATYPSLDMNSTKDYVVSLKEYQLFSDFYYDVYLNAYNTYSNEGLPPGPICNPGRAAIEAALFPSNTNYKFFCHSETGEVYYAATASEHQKNTEKIIYGN